MWGFIVYIGMTQEQEKYIAALQIYGHLHLLEDDETERLVESLSEYMELVPYEGDEDYELQVKWIGKHVEF